MPNFLTTLLGFLPMPWWMGPPLPMSMKVYWQQIGRAGGTSLQLSSVPPSVPLPTTALTPTATYTNEETWDIEWNAEGLPAKIVVHRHAEQ